jgi:hypothetical protein
LIDLRAAHEADIDIAALQQQQHLGAAEHHTARRAPLIVGEGGSRPGRRMRRSRRLRTDGQARTCASVAARVDADTGEYHRPSAQPWRSGWPATPRCGSARQASQMLSRREPLQQFRRPDQARNCSTISARKRTVRYCRMPTVAAH